MRFEDILRPVRPDELQIHPTKHHAGWAARFKNVDWYLEPPIFNWDVILGLDPEDLRRFKAGQKREKEKSGEKTHSRSQVREEMGRAGQQEKGEDQALQRRPREGQERQPPPEVIDSESDRWQRRKWSDAVDAETENSWFST